MDYELTSYDNRKQTRYDKDELAVLGFTAEEIAENVTNWDIECRLFNMVKWMARVGYKFNNETKHIDKEEKVYECV